MLPLSKQLGDNTKYEINEIYNVQGSKETGMIRMGLRKGYDYLTLVRNSARTERNTCSSTA
jgi:hypothetical protein